MFYPELCVTGPSSSFGERSAMHTRRGGGSTVKEGRDGLAMWKGCSPRPLASPSQVSGRDLSLYLGSVVSKLAFLSSWFITLRSTRRGKTNQTNNPCRATLLPLSPSRPITHKSSHTSAIRLRLYVALDLHLIHTRACMQHSTSSPSSSTSAILLLPLSAKPPTSDIS